MENSEPLDGLLSGYTHRTLKKVKCVKTDFRLAWRGRFRYGTGLKAKNEGGKKVNVSHHDGYAAVRLSHGYRTGLGG
jgi:hypothetical protein